MSVSKRFFELDFLKGLAVIGMIVFHLFFILDFFDILKNDVQSGGFYILGQFVRFVFLGLVGVGMVISSGRIFAAGGTRRQVFFRQWKRALIVFACGMIVTFATYFAVPDLFVRFGILHLIGVSIFLWSFMLGSKWMVLFLSLISLWLGGWIYGEGPLDFQIWWLNMQSVDYFPLFPWTGIVGLGIFVGELLYPRGQAKFRFLGTAPLSGVVVSFFEFLSKRSLIIYMTHVPVIILLLGLFGILPLTVIFS